MTDQELDLERIINNLENDIDEFSANQYSSQSDINDALINTFNEIKDDQRIIDNGFNNQINQNLQMHHPHPIHQHGIQISTQHSKPVYGIPLIHESNFPEQLQIKPLTPESVLANDESLFDSPNFSQMITANQSPISMPNNSSADNDSLLINQEDLQIELIHKNELLESELQKYRQLFESKSENLKKAMIELKKSESKRLELMEENRYLKATVSKLIVNEKYL